MCTLREIIIYHIFIIYLQDLQSRLNYTSEDFVRLHEFVSELLYSNAYVDLTFLNHYIYRFLFLLGPEASADLIANCCLSLPPLGLLFSPPKGECLMLS